MRVKCPECKEGFELGKNEHDEGDTLQCPECNIDLTVQVRNGKFVVVTERELLYEEGDENFGDYEDE